MNLLELLAYVEAIAPPALAEDWDNSGIQINCGNKEIKTVLICLDLTMEVLEEAKAIGAELIISHHPLIFEPMKSIDSRNPNQLKIQKLIQSGISVYSAHMTYDKSPVGNTVMLAQRLGLSGIPLERETNGADGDFSALTAKLNPPMTLDAICRLVSERLETLGDEIGLVRGSDKSVAKIGLCAGSGGELLQDFIAEGCTALITGDIKYHIALVAKEAGVSIIDAGHFATEKHFAGDFAKRLSELAGSAIDIHISNRNINPFSKP